MPSDHQNQGVPLLSTLESYNEIVVTIVLMFIRIESRSRPRQTVTPFAHAGFPGWRQRRPTLSAPSSSPLSR
eukprot:160635-Amphidinium_carterae.1